MADDDNHGDDGHTRPIAMYILANSLSPYSGERLIGALWKNTGIC